MEKETEAQILKRLNNRVEYANGSRRHQYTDSELRALVNETNRRNSAPPVAPQSEHFSTIDARRAMEFLRI